MGHERPSAPTTLPTLTANRGSRAVTRGTRRTALTDRVGSLEHSNFVGSGAISSDGRMLATQDGVLDDAGGGVAGYVESGVRLWNPDDI